MREKQEINRAGSIPERRTMRPLHAPCQPSSKVSGRPALTTLYSRLECKCPRVFFSTWTYRSPEGSRIDVTL